MPKNAYLQTVKLCEPPFATHAYLNCTSGARLGSVEERDCFSEFGSGATGAAWAAGRGQLLRFSSTRSCTTITKRPPRKNQLRKIHLGPLPVLPFLDDGRPSARDCCGKPFGSSVAEFDNSRRGRNDPELPVHSRVQHFKGRRRREGKDGCASNGHSSGRVPA